MQVQIIFVGKRDPCSSTLTYGIKRLNQIQSDIQMFFGLLIFHLWIIYHIVIWYRNVFE